MIGRLWTRPAGVRVDGPPARGLWPPFGGGLCKRVVNGKVLKMDGPSAQGFLSLTAFQAEGCGIAHRAMSIKSALRDLLSVSYDIVSTTAISHLRWLPPPLAPYGTTFPPRWEACHTILRSLCSLTNRVPLPPRYRSGDKRKAPLWAG